MTNLGITWQHPSGIALGAGMSYRFGTDARSEIFPEFDDRWLDALGWQFRLAYHPGVRLPRAPAPPPPAPPAPRPAPPAAAAPAPPPPAVVANRPPTVRVQCDPCRVNVGQSLALQADGQDPDGDRLTFRWSTPAGVIADPLSAATRWTATTVPGSLVLTVTGDDGRGGLATGSVTIEVVGAQPTAFDDIRFDYDQTALRPEALAVLQQVVAALRANPAMRLRIEGHASAEGTAEYNLALGERRAVAVRDYISSQGIDAARLATVTYGEERPRYDNAIEGNRALNRRAAFVVLAQ
jgi:outer membrane protein OmpA-like peptidoglycan-associated protein